MLDRWIDKLKKWLAPVLCLSMVWDSLNTLRKLHRGANFVSALIINVSLPYLLGYVSKLPFGKKVKTSDTVFTTLHFLCNL